MENNLSKQKRLEDLIIEEKSFLELLKNFNFKTEREAERYIENNKNDFEKLKKIKEEIRELKLQLMSSQEKQEYLEYQKKIKDKYSTD
ncbi:Uncharacterised protein [Elizabethkingia miricola]|uniref:Uncharacterized protein n=1 Tax=Elizabethkingia miricola TaxID=172045 RepID=A0ABD4DGT2_ELIMR|nr:MULTISPECIES: hypothetical protein [Elizabethkingia]KUY14377.1 hypothetical protein ATB95_18360 [Elizabethkingia miricola]MCL1654337.1 hypothetical protein [Elizabethkingia miricola]MCL1680990.1 hypothetical protein [Elizabethkingia miricola]MCT4139048.1 hypothetical protein [Elizabethkingia anophelis]MYY27072.1 hypothetical protein [Elizabethkingia anophelis]